MVASYMMTVKDTAGGRAWVSAYKQETLEVLSGYDGNYMYTTGWGHYDDYLNAGEMEDVRI